MPPKRAGGGSDEGSVDITTLPPSDLQSIKQRLEGDLDTLVNSQTALNQLVSKFNTSAAAIETLGASQPGQPLLMPLTQSLYVGGKVASSDEVLVDIGTGYYAKMSSDQGLDFCRRKVVKLKENMDMVAGAINEKRQALMQVSSVLQDKVAAMQAQA